MKTHGDECNTNRNKAPDLPAGAGAGIVPLITGDDLYVSCQHRDVVNRRSSRRGLDNEAKDHPLAVTGEEVVDDNLGEGTSP